MNGVVARPIVGLSICSGYGGLELGLKLVLGDDFFCAVHVERDLVAASVLVERMAEGALEQAPVWDDVATFDGTGWRGCVDIVTAGFPCQPFSVAGKRRGVEDERWIWPDIARVIGEVGPEYVFLENVPGLVRHGLGPVLGSLAEMGFDAEWGCFSAAEIGATHKRERVFILAYRDREWESQPEGIDGDQRRRVGYCRSAVATPDGERQQERCATKPAHAQYATAQCRGGVVADASESGSVVGAEAEWGTQSLRGQAESFRLAPMTPMDGGRTSTTRPRLSPRFVSRLMGLPDGWTNSSCSAMESYRSWLHTHSRYLHDVLGGRFSGDHARRWHCERTESRRSDERRIHD
ncbi:MAG: DNA cytosine methyltransferase [Bryobacterales bacterium]|nr:DNA cytosine methyltransferase [Bryobacterales bacterium]